MPAIFVKSRIQLRKKGHVVGMQRNKVVRKVVKMGQDSIPLLIILVKIKLSLFKINCFICFNETPLKAANIF